MLERFKVIWYLRVKIQLIIPDQQALHLSLLKVVKGVVEPQRLHAKHL